MRSFIAALVSLACTALFTLQAASGSPTTLPGGQSSGLAGAHGKEHKASPRGWQAALAAERGHRHAAAHGAQVLPAGKHSVSTADSDLALCSYPPASPVLLDSRWAGAASLAASLFAAFAAGAASGFLLGRWSALAKRPSAGKGTPVAVPQGPMHATAAEGHWQQQQAVAKEELRSSGAAVMAALAAEAESGASADAQAGANDMQDGAVPVQTGSEAAAGAEQAGHDAAEETGHGLGPAVVAEEALGLQNCSPAATDAVGRAAGGAVLEAMSGPGTRVPAGAAQGDNQEAVLEDAEACSTSGREQEGSMQETGSLTSTRHLPWPWQGPAAVRGQGMPLEMEQWEQAAAFWEAFTQEMKVRRQSG